MLEVGSLRWRRNSRMLSHKLILGTFKNCCTISKKEFSLSSFPWFFSLECLLISVGSPFCFSSLSGKCQSGQLHLNLAIPWNEESDMTEHQPRPSRDLCSTLPAAFPAWHPQRPSNRADYIPPLSLLASSTTVLLTFLDSAAPSLAPCSSLVAGSSSLGLSSLQDFHIVNALT